MSRGVKVAPAGTNAAKAGAKDLLYTTDTTSLKLFSSDIVTFKFTSTGSFGFQIPHNLGYVPVYRVFFQPSPIFSDYWYPDSYLTDNLDTARDLNTADDCLAQATSTYIQIYMYGQAGFSYKAKYFIFEDRAI